MFNKRNNINNKTNRKRNVEIYFILYLAALVILISEGKYNKANNEDVFARKDIELPFRIKAEKPILICRISFDQNGNRIIKIDSVNYIWDAGNVRDVRYEFVVEDQDLRQSIRLNNSQDNNQNNRHFSFTEDIENRMAVFLWQPEIYDNSNRTFIVYVTATAINNDFDNNTAENKRVVAKTQFSLVITNDNDPNLNYFATNNIPNNNDTVVETHNYASLQNNISPNTYFSSSVDFAIRPQEFRIRSVANQEWENEIVFFGGSPQTHLNKPPTVRISNLPENNGGTVNTTFIRDNSIVLRGRTPSAGTSRVFVTVVRSGDLRESTVSFEITPVTFGMPEIPTVMFPNIEYTFDPRISNELNNVNVFIKDKDAIRFQSLQGSAFRFTPDISDIGKTLSFERYIQGQLLGQKYNIKVLDFPAPEITRISRQGRNEVILEVVSFGSHKGRDNNIREIKLIGNGKAIQLYGRTRTDKATSSHFEHFQIVPTDAQPLAFEAIAIDQRGESSKSVSFNK